MNQRTSLLLFLLIFISCTQKTATLKIFDVHLHGGKAPAQQLKDLEKAGVYKTAVSTSWNLQQQYSKGKEMSVLHGLMFPCPNGKVPYSQQPCFVDGKDWPSLSWVEEQIQQKKINFLGEVLSQYFGISSSDSLLFPYYALAEKYNLPVGIHTGSAGPDHGSPFFKEEMGNPVLLKKTLQQFPKLKVWIMHAGAPFSKEAIQLMKDHPQVYTDISAINNPRIMPPGIFSKTMHDLVNAGLEDRIMFGSDNGDINTMIASISNLDFLSEEQKEKIFYRNAERFFGE